MLTDVWGAELAELGADSFSSLTSVEIDECKKLDKIFPSHLGGWFWSLERLIVVDCLLVKVIFEIEDSEKKDLKKKGSKKIDASQSVTNTKLRFLVVVNLTHLREIWGRDPRGILSFKNLQSICVSNCDELRYVLPASVAKDLKSLESIWVCRCDKMEEIVAWEDDGSELLLKFPELNSLKLFDLSINHFYIGGDIESPKLKELFVKNCEELETFTSWQGRKPVFYAEKVISNLEILQVDSKEAFWLQAYHGEHLMCRLKIFGVSYLSNIETLYGLMHIMPDLETTLELDTDHLEELVPPRNIVPQERLGTILQLRKLRLVSSDIKNLRLERDPVLQRLEQMILIRCDNLINLAPSSVSLTYLTYLEVSFCYGLTNLMTCSTAKSMVQLSTMKVMRCKLKEVVTTDEENRDGVIEAVVFSKLISLELVGLENLTSFCSHKNIEIKFPCLDTMIVRECPKMEQFTESHTVAPKLQSILVLEGEEGEKGYWEGDLNATIQKVFKDKKID